MQAAPLISQRGALPGPPPKLHLCPTVFAFVLCSNFSFLSNTHGKQTEATHIQSRMYITRTINSRSLCHTNIIFRLCIHIYMHIYNYLYCIYNIYNFYVYVYIYNVALDDPERGDHRYREWTVKLCRGDPLRRDATCLAAPIR